MCVTVCLPSLSKTSFLFIEGTMTDTLSIVLQVITQGSGVITTLTLSLVWIVYSIIPQYLLLHYTWIGRGTTLRYACQVGFYISSLCAFCAIILLWLVYPKTVSSFQPQNICSNSEMPSLHWESKLGNAWGH